MDIQSISLDAPDFAKQSGVRDDILPPSIQFPPTPPPHQKPLKTPCKNQKSRTP
jgi:hypothetical protein